MKLNSDYPVLANTRPWNELILRGIRKFKTLYFPWKYRGTIYLYDTRGKLDPYAIEYGEDTTGRRIRLGVGNPGHIVGTAEVYDSGGERGDAEIYLRSPRRLAKPVPFNWPRRAIRIARNAKGAGQ